MYDDIVKRLESFGYTVDTADEWVIGFLKEKVTNYIKSECNTKAVPDELRQVAIDMICGELLQMKKVGGQLESLEVEADVRQISEGDTSTSYAVSNKPITLDGLIDYLINNGKSQFTSFRRLQW